MGFMTEISILNDSFYQIEQNPELFLKQVRRAMNDHPWDYPTYVIGQTTVHPSHHADDSRIYLADRNSFKDLGEYGIERELSHSAPVDHRLDYYEERIDETIKRLKESKRYVQYLREEIGYDERPGGKDFSKSNDHHIKAWRWRKKKS